MLVINEIEMNSINRANALYHTLRQLKGRDFNADDYKWELGYEVCREFHPFMIYQKIEPTMLYGIKVEFDMHNPHTFRLYEDITDKIAIPYAEFKDIEEEQEND